MYVYKTDGLNVVKIETDKLVTGIGLGGGVTEFLPVAPHGHQNIHVHLTSIISNGMMVEYYRNTTDPM